MCSKRKYSEKIGLLKKVGEIFCSKNYVTFFVKKKLFSPLPPTPLGDVGFYKFSFLKRIIFLDTLFQAKHFII